jgi:uncharacterized DUF497 family protein
MNLKISAAIRRKLREKHGVSEKEIHEALVNMQRMPIKDTREQHDTYPPTWWIISETNKRRELKVLFVVDEGQIHIKTAYEPSQAVVAMYLRKAKMIYGG